MTICCIFLPGKRDSGQVQRQKVEVTFRCSHQFQIQAEKTMQEPFINKPWHGTLKGILFFSLNTKKTLVRSKGAQNWIVDRLPFNRPDASA